ncbi:MAG: hypothetical protein KIT87_00560 [Anaerolineae bacterium]|nr:hypothetical protein [Anaerolineae bacterium]
MSPLRWTLAVLGALVLLSLAGLAAAGPNEAAVTGNVRLQGRSSHGGATVLYDGQPVAATNPDGDFAFLAPTIGPHLVEVKAPGYLSRQFFLDDPSGYINLPPTTLRLGDADGNNRVDIIDLIIVTSNYGQSPPQDPRADLNGDGRVSVTDLIAVSTTYGQRGPQPWTDESSLVWTSRAAMSTPRYHLGVAPLGGLIYAVGGCCALGVLDGQNVFTTVEVFDPNTATWTERSPLPTARQSLAVVAANGKLYAIGGQDRNGQPLAVVEEYTPGADAWTRRAAMPTARSGLAAAVVNGKIYAIGGQAATILATVEEYDPATDTWTTRAALPTPRVFLGAASRGNLVYAIGGWGGRGHLGTVEIYNPVENNWTAGPPLPTPRSELAVVEAHGRLYALGGYHDSQSFAPLAVVEELDVASMTWRTETNLNVARLGLGAAALNDRVYAVGGFGLSYLASVEEGSPTLQIQDLPKQMPKLPASFPRHLLPLDFQHELVK